MISSLLIVGTLVAGYLYSYWFFSASIVLSLFKLHKWYYYRSRPWRIVHFQMMRTYAKACGIEMNESQNNSREFIFKNAVVLMLDLLNPVKLGLTHEQIFDQEQQRLSTQYDTKLISDYLKSKGHSQEDIDSTISAIRKDIVSADEIHTKELIVRMVVASVIEAQFSKMDRGEYMYNVYIGKAI